MVPALQSLSLAVLPLISGATTLLKEINNAGKDDSSTAKIVQRHQQNLGMMRRESRGEPSSQTKNPDDNEDAVVSLVETSSFTEDARKVAQLAELALSGPDERRASLLDVKTSDNFVFISNGSCTGATLTMSASWELLESGQEQTNKGIDTDEYAGWLLKAQNECNKVKECQYISVDEDAAYRTYAVGQCSTFHMTGFGLLAHSYMKHGSHDYMSLGSLGKCETTSYTSVKTYCKMGVSDCGEGSQGENQAGNSLMDCRAKCDAIWHCAAIAYKADTGCRIFWDRCTATVNSVTSGWAFWKKQSTLQDFVMCANQTDTCSCNGIAEFGGGNEWRSLRVDHSVQEQVVCNSPPFPAHQGPEKNLICRCYVLTVCNTLPNGGGMSHDWAHRRRTTVGFAEGTGLHQRRRWCGWGPTDCSFNEWGAWTACSASCGGGKRTRSREINTTAVNGGKCGALLENSDCNEMACNATNSE